MNRRQKQALISGIVALLGVVLILGVILMLTREHRFRKYHHRTDKFTISYPATWTYDQNVGGASVIFFAPKENELDFFKENVNVVVQDLSSETKTLQEYSELAIKQMKLVFEDNFIMLESGPKFVAGQSGYQLIFLGKGPEADLKYMVVWFLKGRKAYQITYTSVDSQYDRYIGKMKRMVGSFSVD